MPEHVVVIGVGLIGGSVARAIKKAGYADRITGAGRNLQRLERALELGVVDHISTNIARAVQDADIVVIATHMHAYQTVFSAIADHLPEHALLTDVGSIKSGVVLDARQYLKNVDRFVPAHPLAGTEQSGVEASFAELFQNHVCVLTPMDETDSDAVKEIQIMWEACGCKVECMSAGEHDDFLAAVSHLPHLVAYALVNAVHNLGDGQHEPFKFAAGGFRDFTRIASSSPDMWRDICLGNREALLRKIDALDSELKLLRRALQEEDGPWLLEEFTSAKRARDTWLAKQGSGQ
ncbi:MAG: prephenate dehydrogenase [Mariprofundaceae bacterium]